MDIQPKLADHSVIDALALGRHWLKGGGGGSEDFRDKRGGGGDCKWWITKNAGI